MTPEGQLGVIRCAAARFGCS